MHQDDIRKVLQHCYKIQDESGPESAFRFSLFIGPKRKRMFSNYPSHAESEENHRSQEGNRRQKDKGKQREDPLQGLLQIDALTVNDIQNEDRPNTIPSAGPSRSHNLDDSEQVASSDQNRLVRIDMGKMLQLKEMEYKVMGPVNGPNEGYPEYEVSNAVLSALHQQCQINPNTNPNDITRVQSPDPSPIQIDPVLLQNMPLEQETTECTLTSPIFADDIPQLNHLSVSDANHNRPTPTNPNCLCDTNIEQEGSGVMLVHGTQPLATCTIEPSDVNNPLSSCQSRPTTPPNEIADSANHLRTPKKCLGKRAQANLSPQTMRQPTTKKKKKKVTNDDLAAMEAQKMLASGSRRKIRPTKR